MVLHSRCLILVNTLYQSGCQTSEVFCSLEMRAMHDIKVAKYVVGVML